MRGFGSVQTAFGYEAQMDKLAAALGMDPVELRCRNAMELGREAPTGQIVDSPAPVAELLRTVRDMPLPAGAALTGDGTGAGPTCGSCPAAWRTPRTARASGAASGTRWPTRTSASPRASTTTRPRGSGWRSPAASRW